MNRWFLVFVGVALAFPILCSARSGYTQMRVDADKPPMDEVAEAETMTGETTTDPEAMTDPEPPAEPLTFSCQISEGTPTTIAQMSEAVIPIVRWDSPVIAVETNQQADCEASAERFQASYNSGSLSYITTGRMEGQLVVCAAEAVGERCLNRLLDLQATQRPRVALQQVLQIRLPTEGPISDTGTIPYVSLSRYLSGGYWVIGDW